MKKFLSLVFCILTVSVMLAYNVNAFALESSEPVNDCNVENEILSTEAVENYAFKVMTGENEAYYGSFAEALSNAESGSIITILEDITLSESFSVNEDITIRGLNQNITIKRENGFAGTMLDIKSCTVVIEDIILDGGAEWTGDIDTVLGRGTKNAGIKANSPAISVSGSNVTMNSVTVQNNYSSGYAGAVYIKGTGSLNIDGCSFINNSCSKSSDGGAIYNMENTDITAADSKFSGNYAAGNGGAIYSIKGKVTVSDCTFSECMAGSNGGAICVLSGNIVFNSGNINNCMAENGGGAISNKKGNVTVNYGTFIGNHAKLGGAFYSIFSGNVTIYDGKFKSNFAEDTGGLICSSYANEINIYGGTYTENSAGNSGGVIYTGAASESIISSGYFYGNYTDTGKGGEVFYSDGGGNHYISGGLFISASGSKVISQPVTFSAFHVSGGSFSYMPETGDIMTGYKVMTSTYNDDILYVVVAEIDNSDIKAATITHKNASSSLPIIKAALENENPGMEIPELNANNTVMYFMISKVKAELNESNGVKKWTYSVSPYVRWTDENDSNPAVIPNSAINKEIPFSLPVESSVKTGTSVMVYHGSNSIGIYYVEENETGEKVINLKSGTFSLFSYCIIEEDNICSENIEGSTFAFRKASLEIQNDISVVYKVEADGNYKNPYAVFEIYNSDTEKYDKCNVNYYCKNGNFYYFKYEGVNPQRIADNIKATVYAEGTDDGNIYKITNSYYSVREYCVNRINNSSEQLMKNLACDMLYYGYVSASYRQYSAEFSLGSINNYARSADPADFSDIKTVEKVKTEGEGNVDITGITLELSNTVALKVFFTLPNDNAENAMLKICIGEKVSDYSYENFMINPKNESEYYILFDNISAADFDSVITVYSYDNGIKDDKVTYSVNTYIKDTITKDDCDEKLVLLLKALYNYGKSSRYYSNRDSV